ncbi:MAG TPA: carbon-nitrogen hydrolase family protein, partial [Atribacterota bacterium]|nr:carbon-nitrogen hydrolase family protein [Atribacterota bacterium]
MKNKSIRIACLQLEAMPYRKHSENKEKILRLIKQASESQAKLIVLPECVYPCYFLSPDIIDSHTELSSLTTQFLAEIKIYAKKYQVFIAIGLPEYNKEKNALYNSAYLIADNGEIIGMTRKSFLWHFDNIWFQSDNQYPVFDTKIGKIGIFICADGRVPEIVRCLALQGAEILLDLTNLVTNGLEKESWSNPQIDYMLPTRALENKVWIVAANKVGVEEKSIQYCGKSSFFSREGETLTMASTDREEILIKDINLDQSHNKEIANLVNIFEDRHPELYRTLTSPTSELPITNNQDKVINHVKQSPFASIIQTEDIANIDVYSQKLKYFFQTLKWQEVNIFSFSQNNEISVSQNQVILDLLKNLTKDKPALCSIVLNENEGMNKYKTIFLIQSGEIMGKYRKTHLELTEKNKINPGKDDFAVYNTNFGTIGMMLDYEGYFPEIARILTLKGAQMIIWPCRFSGDEQLKICQTRSSENKIFIVCPNSIEGNSSGHSLISNPN